jgi:hypothetical protein
MMDQAHRQLVERIAAEVVKLLRARGGAPGASTPQANVRPPIGTCTGDYSKFPELAGQTLSQPRPAQSAPQAEPAVVPLTGIITANQLQASMDAAPDGVAVVATDARLTPLANDLARQHPQKIRRASAVAQAAAAASNRDTWLSWMDGHCGVAEQLVAQRGGVIQPMRATSMAQVVRDVASAVRSHRAAGAVLFVPNAAKAMCFANRCPSLRAVVGTCDQAVEQGINEVGANVLVIEYPHHGERSMATMIDRMLGQTPTAPPSVQRELSELHRSG